jgi:hypothetical protein
LKRINREKVFRIWSLILLWKGISKYRNDYPILEICGDHFSPQFKRTQIVAEYDPIENTVTIWWRKHKHIEEITSTLLHEYTHYLQFWPWYSRYSNLLSYSKNPYEIQAFESESDTQFFLQNVSDKPWKGLIKKYPSLKRIYNQVSESGYILS